MVQVSPAHAGRFGIYEEIVLASVSWRFDSRVAEINTSLS